MTKSQPPTANAQPGDGQAHAGTGAHCPVCTRPFQRSRSDALPFCSRRCQLVDLGRWIDERYRVTIPSAADQAVLEGVEEAWQEPGNAGS